MPSMNDKDYYSILGVSSDASTDDIRKSFQKLARQYHPDINKEAGAEEKFKEISEAYAVLSDPDKRKRYDAMRSGMPYGGSYRTGGYSSGRGDPFTDMDFEMWGFPFSGTGAGTRRTYYSTSRSYNPRQGSDVSFNLDLDSEAAKKGVSRGVTYQRYVSCTHCSGTGSTSSAHAETCPTCGGTGHMSVDLSSIFGFGVFEVECPECEGSGKVVSDPCPHCGGSGRVLSADEIVVEVPPKSHDGDEIRVTGAGNAGTNGSASGDFVCRVSVKSEHLASYQSSGFQIVGFVLPFVLMSVFSGFRVGLFTILFAAYGVYSIFRGGIKADIGWWRNAGRALIRGAEGGLVIALLMFMMYSCFSGFGFR